jgi:hypothetical protein
MRNFDAEPRLLYLDAPTDPFSEGGRTVPRDGKVLCVPMVRVKQFQRHSYLNVAEAEHTMVLAPSRQPGGVGV